MPALLLLLTLSASEMHLHTAALNSSLPNTSCEQQREGDTAHITPHNHCVHKTSPIKLIADCNTVGVLVYMPIYLIVDFEDYPNSTHIYSVVAATVDRKYCGYRNPCTPLVRMHIHMSVCTYICTYAHTYVRMHILPGWST